MLKELKELEEVQSELIQYAAENSGEIDETLENKLEVLRDNILSKTNRYLRYLKSNKFKELLSYLKQKRKEITQAEKALERIKGYMLYCLAQVIPEEGMPVRDDEGHIEYMAFPDETISHTIDVSRVEPQYGRYILPPMDYTEFSLLKKALESVPEEHRVTLEKLFAKAERKVLLGDLPEKHPAIKEIRKFRIKFRKR